MKTNSAHFPRPYHHTASAVPLVTAALGSDNASPSLRFMFSVWFLRSVASVHANITLQHIAHATESARTCASVAHSVSHVIVLVGTTERQVGAGSARKCRCIVYTFGALRERAVVDVAVSLLCLAIEPSAPEVSYEISILSYSVSMLSY